jgi:hypothetical protein
MNGETMRQAKTALQQAIQMLSPVDYFTICAFDHELIWFQCPLGASPILFHAEPQVVYAACQWIDQIEARGLTDILTPYQIATDLLSHPKTSQSFTPNQVNGPYKVDSSQPPFLFILSRSPHRALRALCSSISRSSFWSLMVLFRTNKRSVAMARSSLMRIPNDPPPRERVVLRSPLAPFPLVLPRSDFF